VQVYPLYSCSELH